MGPYDANRMGAVTLYDFYDCRGDSTRAYWVPWDIDGGQYVNEDLRSYGMEDNTVTSIQVPRGYTAILYKDDAFFNELASYKGWYKNLQTQELGCNNLPVHLID